MPAPGPATCIAPHPRATKREGGLHATTDIARGDGFALADGPSAILAFDGETTRSFGNAPRAASLG